MLTLGGLAWHARKATKAGALLGGAVSTGALFLLFLTVLLATGVLDPDVSRAMHLGEFAYNALRWMLELVL